MRSSSECNASGGSVLDHRSKQHLREEEAHESSSSFARSALICKHCACERAPPSTTVCALNEGFALVRERSSKWLDIAASHVMITPLSPSRPHRVCKAAVAPALQPTTHFQAPRASRTSQPTRWRRSYVANSLCSGLQASVARVAAICLAAALACTSLPSNAASVLANKPTYAADYAAVVRKREGKSKSSLPSSREAEALLEINEDLFTTEALEGMSRYISDCVCWQLETINSVASAFILHWGLDHDLDHA